MYQLARNAITKIINEEGFVNLVISEYLRQNSLTDHERRLFTRIVYGTVEKYLLLDYYLQPYIKGKRLKPYLKNTLRMGLYMLFFMDIANHFVVNELVKMVKKQDFKGSQLINGVFRNILKDGLRLLPNDYDETLSLKYSYPLPLVKVLKEQYPEDIEHILVTSEEKYNTYRINFLKTNLEEVKNYLQEENIEYQLDSPTLWTKQSLISSELFENGKIVAQDAASQKVALVHQPAKGSSVLDACSAPGSKTCHMAEMMANQGHILALDIYEHKLKLIEDGANKQGVTIIETLLQDARTFTSIDLFDSILVDAPCSGLGVMDHKVDLKYRMTEEKMKELADIQKAILNNLAKMVKVNGYLTYSTCTINKNENTYQITEFLKYHPEYEKLEEYTFLPDAYYDGFYICKLQRKA